MRHSCETWRTGRKRKPEVRLTQGSPYTSFSRLPCQGGPPSFLPRFSFLFLPFPLLVFSFPPSSSLPCPLVTLHETFKPQARYIPVTRPQSWKPAAAPGGLRYSGASLELLSYALKELHSAICGSAGLETARKRLTLQQSPLSAIDLCRK